MREKDDTGTHRPFGHPCFDAKSHGSVGRIHLPVAPACNIKCNYCTRKHDCANENRPGVTSRIINPQEALARIGEAVRLEPRIKVVGIAGPGDPLANQATFTTLALVKKHFPQLSLCLSTNGLLLPDKLEELVDLGVGTITVTVNTLSAETGSGIYAGVRYRDEKLTGIKGATVLRDNQVKGVRMAVEAGISVKINSVLLPGINEHEMVSLSQAMRELGVSVMNIMRLIPQAGFAHLEPVPPQVHQKIRETCSLYLPQIYHCRQCRADAAGLLGQDLESLFGDSGPKAAVTK